MIKIAGKSIPLFRSIVIKHFHQSLYAMNMKEDLQDSGLVGKFFQQDYLHWLEALSLLGSIPAGVSSMLELQLFVKVRFPLSPSYILGCYPSLLTRALVQNLAYFVRTHERALANALQLQRQQMQNKQGEMQCGSRISNTRRGKGSRRSPSIGRTSGMPSGRKPMRS